MSLVYCCLPAERHMDKCAICHDVKDIGCLLYIAIAAWLQRHRQTCYMSWWQRHWMSFVYCCLIADTYGQMCYMSWCQRHWMSFLYCCLTAETCRQTCYMSWWQRHWMSFVYCCLIAYTYGQMCWNLIFLTYGQIFDIWTNVLYVMMSKTLYVFCILLLDYRHM